MSEFKPYITIDKDALYKEALLAKQLEKLDVTDAALYRQIERQREVIAAEEVKLDALQVKCTHPLTMRSTKNEGWSNDWDRTSAYWTVHNCGICGKQWHTSQRWMYLGGKKGLPDDLEAKDK